jgi:hypothetical protein
MDCPHCGSAAMTERSDRTAHTISIRQLLKQMLVPHADRAHMHPQTPRPAHSPSSAPSSPARQPHLGGHSASGSLREGRLPRRWH